jgi:zinc protease
MPILGRCLRLIVITFLACVYLPFFSLSIAADLHALLPTDPAVRIGRLDNGVSYWVRSHATPPGKIAFWLHVATGSVNE